MKNLDLSQALSAALQASRLSRQVLLDYFGQLKQVQEKAQAGLVSEADLESEKVIREELKKSFPAIPMLGEEESFTQSQIQLEPNQWVVDPLDGTTNYVHGFPAFCISIGLRWQGELAVGVVDVPMLNRTYTCAKGQGAFVNGERMKVSDRSTIKESLLATGFFPDNPSALKEQLRIFSDLVYQARGIRRAGAAAYDLCLVAEGVFDAFWEKNLKPWDTAAGALMVREAGGSVWNYSRGEYQLGEDSILAGNGFIPAQIADRIQHLNASRV